MKIIIHIILISALIFSSCVNKVIDFDFAYEGDQLVLYSTIGSDGKIWAKVYKTLPPLQDEYNFELITDATVTLFENGVSVATLNLSNNEEYLLEYPVSLTNEYHIKVVTSELEATSDKVSFPPPKEILFLNHEYNVDGYWLYYDYQFDDARGKNNYLHKDFAYYRDTIIEGLFFEGNEWNSGINNLQESMIGFFEDYEYNSPNLDGSRWTIEKGVPIAQPVDDGEQLLGFQQAYKVHVYLIEASQEISDFNEGQNYYLSIGDEYYIPEQSYTNINGGYGVVGTYTINEKIIELD